MVRHFALVYYDHLGRAVVLNLVWLVASLPWIAAGSTIAWLAAGLGAAYGRPALGLPGVVAGGVLVALSPATFFVVAATDDWLDTGDANFGSAWRRTRSVACRVQALGAAMAFLAAALVGNAFFYQSWGGWLGLGLSGVMLWLLVGVVLLALFLLSILATRPETTWHSAVADAGRLIVVHPLAACGLLAGAAVQLGVATVSGVGLVLGGIPAVALWCNLGLRLLLARHGGNPVERDPRGWRDLLRPWQG